MGDTNHSGDGEGMKFIAKFITAVLFETMCLTAPVFAGMFDDIPSMDTTPVGFDSNGTHYRIPRNYIVEMDHWHGGPQKSVTLKMTYPDLQPYSKETEDLFRDWPGFILEVDMLPGLHESEDGFENMIKLMDDKNPEPGPFGFEHYHVGPSDAREDFWKKTAFGRIVIFDCTPFDNHGLPDGLCHHVVRTRSGAIISYFFSERHLDIAADVDEKIRNLIDSFSTGVAR
jgi:hypothetical protein